ncbi:MAG: FHA domain-containing protein [Planctomycetota bacterium]|nr:FHA domain-containing protein [Planctomycetota bacterium]
MPKLIVTGPDHVPHEFAVTREMTLGRHPGNDISIPEEKASRRHCRFQPQGDKIVVEDLGSSNGTKVNGAKIQMYTLKHGDTITIGAHMIVFQEDNAPPPEAPLFPGLEAESKDKSRAGEVGAVHAAIDVPAAAELAPLARGKSGSTAARKIPSARVKPIPAGIPDIAPPPRQAEEDEAPPAEETTRPAASAAPVKHASFALAGTIAAAVAVGLAVVLYQNWSSSVAVGPVPAPKVPPNRPPATPAKKKDDGKTVLPVPPKLDPVKVEDNAVPPPPKVDPLQPPADEATVAEEWKKAQAEGRRAMDSGNFAGARAHLNGFLARHPGGEFGQRAQKELADTNKLIDAALDMLLKDAQKAVAEKQYRLATQRCTRLMSADPSGKCGAAAHDLLTKMDESTEPLFAECQKQVAAQVAAGLLDKASAILEKALDDFGGTKWAEQVSALQLQVLMARSFMRQLEAERAKLAASGKPIAVTASSRKAIGVLVGVSGLTLELKSGLRPSSVPIKDLTPEEFQKVLQPLKLADKHVELAYLWLLLERSAGAQAEVERALLDPEQASGAIRLVSLLPNQRNLHVYDFSKWQHQSDWEALSGSWSTQNGRYTLDSADGGDTALKTTALGGAFPAKNARISFQFELLNPGTGYFFAFEFGDEKSSVSLIFTEKGLNLHANVKGTVNERDAWTPGPTHVDFAVSGDTVSVRVNGKPAKALEVGGVSALRGTLTFRVRESGCAIGNVILRSVE